MGMTFDEQEDGTSAEDVDDAQMACEEVSGWNMDYIVFTGIEEAKPEYAESWLKNKEEFYNQCNEYFIDLLFNMAIVNIDGAEYTLSDIYSPDNIPDSSEDGSIIIQDLDTLIQAAQRDLIEEADNESDIEIIAITDLKLTNNTDDGELLLGNEHWYIDFALLNDIIDIQSNALEVHSDRILQSAITLES